VSLFRSGRVAAPGLDLPPSLAVLARVSDPRYLGDVRHNLASGQVDSRATSRSKPVVPGVASALANVKAVGRRTRAARRVDRAPGRSLNGATVVLLA
jgi:hypothetical protein